MYVNSAIIKVNKSQRPTSSQTSALSGSIDDLKRLSTVEFVGQSANLIYKVVDSQKNCYSLRFHLTKSKTMESFWTEPEVINSEMIWLQTLSEETDLVVPMSYRNSKGEFVTEVNAVKYTLIGWVEGEQKTVRSYCGRRF